jgi:hypothetical protein
LGYHDLSALLLNPKVPISKQQYKGFEPGQVYVFMPLSFAVDQAGRTETRDRPARPTLRPDVLEQKVKSLLNNQKARNRLLSAMKPLPVPTDASLRFILNSS